MDSTQGENIVIEDLCISALYPALLSFLFCVQVLVTVPLTLLQKNMIQFNPPLPERKLKAIHSLGAGIIEKVISIKKYPCPQAHTHKILVNFYCKSSSSNFVKHFFRLQFSFHADSGTKKSKGPTTLVTFHQILTRGACLVFSMIWTHRFVSSFFIHRLD